MSHDERKNTMLPCGYTVAQSWAAVRKAWLGFIISRNNQNFDLMSKYASIIRKVQRQLGVQQTDFDFEIDRNDLDEDEQDSDESIIDIDYIAGAKKSTGKNGNVPDGSPEDMEATNTIVGTDIRDIGEEGGMEVRRACLHRREVEYQSVRARIRKSGRKSCTYLPHSNTDKAQREERKSWHYRGSDPDYSYSSSSTLPVEDENWPGSENQLCSDDMDRNGEETKKSRRKSCTYSPKGWNTE